MASVLDELAAAPLSVSESESDQELPDSLLLVLSAFLFEWRKKPLGLFARDLEDFFAPKSGRKVALLLLDMYDAADTFLCIRGVNSQGRCDMAKRRLYMICTLQSVLADARKWSIFEVALDDRCLSQSMTSFSLTSVLSRSHLFPTTIIGMGASRLSDLLFSCIPFVNFSP